MAKSPATKKTFGGCEVARFGPPATPAWPKAINVVVSFEEALKLHLSLGQALAKLNSYNRSKTAGRRSAVNVCIYTEVPRVTVTEGVLPE